MELCSTVAALVAVGVTLRSTTESRLVLVALAIVMVAALALSISAPPQKAGWPPARSRGRWRGGEVDGRLLAVVSGPQRAAALRRRRFHGALVLPAEVTWLWFAGSGLVALRRPENEHLIGALWPLLLAASAGLLVLIFSRVLDIWSARPARVESGPAVDQFCEAYLSSLRAAVHAETSTAPVRSSIRPRLPSARVALMDDERSDAYPSQRTAL